MAVTNLRLPIKPRRARRGVSLKTDGARTFIKTEQRRARHKTDTHNPNKQQKQQKYFAQ